MSSLKCILESVRRILETSSFRLQSGIIENQLSRPYRNLHMDPSKWYIFFEKKEMELHRDVDYYYTVQHVPF